MDTRDAVEALKGKPFIALPRLENILRRENSIIAEEDVAILMDVLYGELGLPTPQELRDEIAENRRARGDDDDDEPQECGRPERHKGLCRREPLDTDVIGGQIICRRPLEG